MQTDWSAAIAEITPQVVRIETANGLCFFSGRVSAVYDKHFLVDGTAIHGVSGGPAFCSTTGGLRIVGSISAYLPNLVEKGAFPGLSVITHAFAHGDIKVTGG